MSRDFRVRWCIDIVTNSGVICYFSNISRSAPGLISFTSKFSEDQKCPVTITVGAADVVVGESVVRSTLQKTTMILGMYSLIIGLSPSCYYTGSACMLLLIYCSLINLPYTSLIHVAFARNLLFLNM